MTQASSWQLAHARRLLLHARERLDAADPFSTADAVTMAQDAVELFLVLVAQRQGIAVGPQDGFAKVLDKVGKLSPVDVFVHGLSQLNHMRVGVKHKGVPPDPVAARSAVEHAEVGVRAIAHSMLGIDLDDVGLADWLEHRMVADALRRAQRVLEIWPNGDRQAFAVALGEARTLLRMQAAWLAGIRARQLRLGDELRQRETREIPRAVMTLADLTSGHLDVVREELARLVGGSEHEPLWNSMLPSVSLTHSGRLHCVGSHDTVEAKYDGDMARRLLLSLLEFAQRLDRRRPVPCPRLVKAVCDADATFGEGEEQRVAAILQPRKPYLVLARGQGVAAIELFGLRLAVPEHAFEAVPET